MYRHVALVTKNKEFWKLSELQNGQHAFASPHLNGNANPAKRACRECAAIVFLLTGCAMQLELTDKLVWMEGQWFCQCMLLSHRCGSKRECVQPQEPNQQLASGSDSTTKQHATVKRCWFTRSTAFTWACGISVKTRHQTLGITKQLGWP